MLWLVLFPELFYRLMHGKGRLLFLFQNEYELARRFG